MSDAQVIAILATILMVGPNTFTTEAAIRAAKLYLDEAKKAVGQ